MAAASKALVVGGGIGGLTAAVALRRQGVAVDLVEIQPEWTVYGVGIIQPNNTLRALDKIDLARTCVDAGAPFGGWRQHDVSGAVVLEGATGTSAAPDFPAVNGITRPRLQEILIAAARDLGAALRLGVTTRELDDQEDGVEVRFTDGSRGCYDLVVASDGINSPTRRTLLGDRYAPEFGGQGVWRYNLERPPEVDWGAAFFGPASKVGLVPIAPKLMYMFVVTEERADTRFRHADMADLMRARIGGYGGIVARLAPMITDPDGVVYRPIENVLVQPPWYKGRVLLIGDAAHATTPHLNQGAAMAIEDAVLLAELVGKGSDLHQVLAAFMDRRFPRASYVVENSKQIAAWELDEWHGIKTPGADPGGLHHRSSVELLADF